jgi:hypothetical protein
MMRAASAKVVSGCTVVTSHFIKSETIMTRSIKICVNAPKRLPAI